MLTCIACSKQLNTNGSLREPPEDDENAATPSTKQAIKALTAQLRLHAAASRKGIEAKLKALSSGSTTPASVSGRTESVLFMEEDEPKEWVAQVEPGVLITFVSLPQGGNDLKRIRSDIEVFLLNLHGFCSALLFSKSNGGEENREIFNKWQAQRWWADNYDKVMELYNVQRFNRHEVPLPTPPRSEDEYVFSQNSKLESVEDSPMTPPLGKEHPPRHFHRPTGVGYSSSDSVEHHLQSRHYHESGGLNSTPKLSSISAAKTETSSIDASARSSSSRRSTTLENFQLAMLVI
ncbi:hypothetical protein DH2020_041209 [Rehmannia glutinosa]|uniref:BRX domain-containing protein n=1 Tax=Rehmannia glutinosa TaxID=99300 RepID=A0ABR0URG5_REHGL